MKSALSEFENGMERVRALHALHSSLSKQVTPAVDLSDVLRAEFVFAVSAFDLFVHELARLGMLEVFSGKRPRTDAFDRWQVSMAAARGMADAVRAEDILDAAIRERHGFVSFQDPDKVAEAVRLFSSTKLWDEVAKECGEKSTEDAKRSFRLIIDRRNKIAHEADRDPSYPEQRWPIDRESVDNVLNRIEKVARAIFKVAV